jgi:hypothetical protein
MAAARYFDSYLYRVNGAETALRLGPSSAAPDWIVTELSHNPSERAYPYRTAGVNLNLTEDEPDRAFSWRVPDLATWRYDLSSALCDTCTAMRAAYPPSALHGRRRPHMCAEHEPLIAKGRSARYAA